MNQKTVEDVFVDRDGPVCLTRRLLDFLYSIREKGIFKILRFWRVLIFLTFTALVLHIVSGVSVSILGTIIAVIALSLYAEPVAGLIAIMLFWCVASVTAILDLALYTRHLTRLHNRIALVVDVVNFSFVVLGVLIIP